MSRERARRRAERERVAAELAAARQVEQRRQARRVARVSALTSRLPRRAPRPGGVLAERRRRQLWATVALLVVVDVVAWNAFPSWSARALALIVTLLAAPVLHTLLFRRA
ncbi:MAG: hypothetical protein LH468_02980 [Nocardioides sp.]|nr:hypothetical protein [Nocardioides sp.]